MHFYCILYIVLVSNRELRLFASRQNLRRPGRATQRLQGRGAALPAGGGLRRDPEELPLLPLLHAPLLLRLQDAGRQQCGVGLWPQLVLSRPAGWVDVELVASETACVRV